MATTPADKKIYIKQGSTAPALPVQIIEEETNAPLNLSGASAVFSMRLEGESTAKINKSAAVITDASNGVIKYSWGDSDLSTVGRYKAEFLVTLAGGKIAKFPNQGYLEINVVDALDEATT